MTLFWTAAQHESRDHEPCPQSRVVGGCRLDRRIDDLITGAGLDMVELTTEYGDGPKPFSYLYRSRAAA